MANPGESILMPRNVHISVIKICASQNINPIFFDLEISSETGHYKPITKNWLKNVSMNIDSGLSEIAITKIEKMLIRTALEKSNGKKNDAAQILGWGRNTLSKKMKEHGI